METQTKPWNYYNMQLGNENELLRITFHTYLPTTKYTDQRTEGQRL
jgi:hypothetical protein